MSLWSAQKQEQWLSENEEKCDNKYQGYWYFPVVLNFEPFKWQLMLYKVVLTSDSVDEIL